jgi:hypothetical protein
MRTWIWLVNNLHYYEAKLSLWLIHVGIVWPHSSEALLEVWESDRLVDVYQERLWDEAHPGFFDEGGDTTPPCVDTECWYCNDRSKGRSKV